MRAWLKDPSVPGDQGGLSLLGLEDPLGKLPECTVLVGERLGELGQRSG